MLWFACGLLSLLFDAWGALFVDVCCCCCRSMFVGVCCFGVDVVLFDVLVLVFVVCSFVVCCLMCVVCYLCVVAVAW